jgi:hypothetical protein
MSFPHLLSFEFFSSDNEVFPSHIAWTCANSDYKSVSVRPDDSWLHKENLMGMHTDLESLLFVGEDILDIAREISQDLEEATFFCEDPELAERVMETLYTSIRLDVPCEFRPISDLFPELDVEQIELLRREVMDELGLAAGDYEENMLVYRAMIARNQVEQDENGDW